MPSTLKIAFIGSHGVGKTTLCYGLAARLKARDLSVEVVREVARRCPLPINEETGVAAQSWILHTQVAEELAAEASYPVVICDRSVLDNYVYMLLALGRQKALEQLIAHWTATYDLLVHVPIVREPRPDGMRSTDPAFQRAVEERLMAEIHERRLDCLGLCDLDRGAWLEYVEEHVRSRLEPRQLELL
jgi:nicotinamide riboside kinase